MADLAIDEITALKQDPSLLESNLATKDGGGALDAPKSNETKLEHPSGPPAVSQQPAAYNVICDRDSASTPTPSRISNLARTCGILLVVIFVWLQFFADIEDFYDPTERFDVSRGWHPVESQPGCVDVLERAFVPIFTTSESADDACIDDELDSDESWVANRAFVAYEVPLDAEIGLILSAPSRVQGSVFVYEDRTARSGVARVDIEVEAGSYQGLQGVGVCWRQGTEFGGDGRNWIQIEHNSARYKSLFHGIPQVNIRVGLPSRSFDDDGVLMRTFIRSLELDLSSMRVAFDDLSNYEFGHFGLRTTNKAVGLEDVSGSTVIVETANSPIHGSYNVSHSLVLVTSNALIDAVIHMYNDAASSPTTAKLQTSNGKIETAISLYSTHYTSNSGVFQLYAKTSNKPLELVVQKAPLDSSIHLTGETSNAPAEASLPAAFEGEFSLATSNARAEVMQNEVDDPAGKGRERIVDVWEQGGEVARGSVEWDTRFGMESIGKEEEGVALQGSGIVRVSTSNGRVQLIL